MHTVEKSKGDKVGYTERPACCHELSIQAELTGEKARQLKALWPCA